MRTSLPSLLAASALSLAACGGHIDPSSGAPDEAEVGLALATESCGATRYNQALAHYRDAVAWSKERIAAGVCESEHGYLWQIADATSNAVMTCGAFRDVVRTSPWAAPLRQVLAPSLTSLSLRSFTGELKVIRDSSYQSWTGVEAFFEKGLSFWARAEGAYGSSLRIHFAASGQATVEQLVHDDVTGDISLEESSATYTVEQPGTAAGKRLVRVRRGAQTFVFTLGVQNPLRYSDAPLFVLMPSIFPAGEEPTALYSLVGECDA
jgi:hypothetical protein